MQGYRQCLKLEHFLKSTLWILLFILIFRGAVHVSRIHGDSFQQIFSTPPTNKSLRTLSKAQNSEKRFCPPIRGKVSILVIYNSNTAHKYTEALDSLKCYASARKYSLFLKDPFNDKELVESCKSHSSLLFRKHCAAAKYLAETDWLMVLDADTGIVNPNHCIEEYIKPEADLIFYERFHNGEIMAGNYIARNSAFSASFLRKWAEFESQLPRVLWNNADNGALHIHLLQTFASSNHQAAVSECLAKWKSADKLPQYDDYVACTRRHLFPLLKHNHSVKIFPRSHGWARDSWTTNGRFGTADFMLHAMKAPEKPHFTGPFPNCQPNSKNMTYPLRPGVFIPKMEEMKLIIAQADAKVSRERPISIGNSSIAACWPNCL